MTTENYRYQATDSGTYPMTLYYSSLVEALYVAGRYEYNSNWYLSIFEMDPNAGTV
jgi:hypothetical protein